MKSRVISAIVMLLIVVPILIVGGIPYYLSVGLLGCIAYNELVSIRKKTSNDYPSIIKYLGLISMLLLIYSNFEKYGLIFGLSYKILSCIMLALFIPIIFYKNKYKITDAFNLFSNVLFIGIGFNLLISVYNFGIKYFILLILITTLTDTFALFGGRLIGKHKFTAISPNKTIEGCIVGSFISTFVCTVYYINIIGLTSNLITTIGIILLLSIIGQCGDLFFSAVKREYDIKDFGKLIPGHGGVLDRLDSIIFVLIAFIMVLNYI